MIEKSKIQHGLFRGIWIGLGTVICISIITIILYQHREFQHILDTTLSDLQWIQLFVGWSMMIIAIFVLGFRYKALLPPHPKLTGLFLGSCLSGGLLLNYAIPGPFGEIVGAYFVQQKSSISLSHATASAIVARILGLITAAFGSLLCYLLLPDLEIANSIIHLLMWGIFGGSTILFGILFLPKYIPQKHPLITSMVQACLSLSNLPPSRFVQAIFWSIVGHLFAFLGVYLSLDALGETSQILGILFSYLTSTCCGAIAFLFPGSQFTWDAIFASLLVASSQYSIESAGVGVLFLRIEQVAMMLFGSIPLMWLTKQLIGTSSKAEQENSIPEENINPNPM